LRAPVLQCVQSASDVTHPMPQMLEVGVQRLGIEVRVALDELYPVGTDKRLGTCGCAAFGDTAATGTLSDFRREHADRVRVDPGLRGGPSAVKCQWGVPTMAEGSSCACR